LLVSPLLVRQSASAAVHALHHLHAALHPAARHAAHYSCAVGERERAAKDDGTG